MYLSPWQGLTTPWGRNFNVNTNILSLRSFVASFKNISLRSDFIPFFHILYMYTAAGQGQTIPGDKILMSTETSCHFAHLLPIPKKISLKSDFIQIFFMILYMYIVPGQGLTTPWGRNFNVNRNILSLRSFVASFKKISLKSDFIQFVSWFYTCI